MPKREAARGEAADPVEGDAVPAVASVLTPYTEEEFTPPRAFELTVVAVDPAFLGADGKAVRAKVSIPATRLEPGPRGPRFHVVDFNATTRVLVDPVDMAPGPMHAGWIVRDQFDGVADEDLASPACRAQNVYAIAARTLASFEFALGRPVPWAFGGHHLYLVPVAFAEANAYYADEDQALYFGFFEPSKRPPVYSCLSYDIVAHETTHAILDGLRRRYDDPGLPDQFAFHEGFADVVALLSVFSMPEVVARSLEPGTEDEIPKDAVADGALLSSPLLELAKQFGDDLHVHSGHGLRNSVRQHPTKAWKDLRNRGWLEPHRRGEILVAAVTQSLLLMWRARLLDLVRHETLSRARAADEGARAARHLLEMAIRAIDYCPPVEFEFRDFLGAILTSDTEVAPSDNLDYRGRLIEAFGRFGIEPEGIDASRFTGSRRLVYRNFHYAVLRTDPDEAARFIWENASVLGVDPTFYLHVEDVRPAVRIGPDGYVVSETVVDYVQELIGTAPELRKLAGPQFGAGLPDDVPIKLFGGGTLIFDQFGGVKYHFRKPIGEWERQQRRLEYLVGQGIRDTKGRFGFSSGARAGQRFAVFHRRDAHPEEEW